MKNLGFANRVSQMMVASAMVAVLSACGGVHSGPVGASLGLGEESGEQSGSNGQTGRGGSQTDPSVKLSAQPAFIVRQCDNNQPNPRMFCPRGS